MVKVGINGFGRIGRNVLRAALGRDDFQVYRSKELAPMLQAMDEHSRSIILFAHRNSKLILTHNVPPHFRVVYVGKLGLCDMAVIER